MDIHKNAPLSFRSREALARFVVEQGATRKAAAAAFRVSAKTAGQVGGAVSWPAESPGCWIAVRVRIAARARQLLHLVEKVLALRRGHMPGYEIARRTGLSPASVSRILRRARLSRWRDLNPPPPVQRYEHPRPGDLLHLDIKGMTRFAEVSLRGDGRLRGKRKHPGFLALHVAVDDHSRMAFTQMLPDQKAETTIGFLNSAVEFFATPRHRHPRPADRQRLQLPLTPVPPRLPANGHQTQPHQALHTENQRKGRALHPDRPARMGLCKTLDRLRAKRRSLAALDRLLQPRKTPW